MDGTELTIRQAENMLTEWAVAVADRNNVVRLAREAGVTKMRIHLLTGLSRATINTILAGSS